MATHVRPIANDDPRRLRELFGRTRDLAVGHDVATVVVGLAGEEGDILFPDFVGFVESALRVEDAIFRMTRDRAVAFLCDVDRDRAAQIMERLREDFRDRFPTATPLRVTLGYFEVGPGRRDVTAKEILPAVFAVEA
jgi:hypothetical protein